jgi:hypothetical protein
MQSHHHTTASESRIHVCFGCVLDVFVSQAIYEHHHKTTALSLARGIIIIPLILTFTQSNIVSNQTNALIVPLLRSHCIPNGKPKRRNPPSKPSSSSWSPLRRHRPLHLPPHHQTGHAQQRRKQHRPLLMGRRTQTLSQVLFEQHHSRHRSQV